MAAFAKNFRKNLASVLLESLLAQHANAPKVQEIPAVRSGNGTLFLLPAREHDPNAESLIEAARALIAPYGPTEQTSVAGFHALHTERYSPKSLRRVSAHRTGSLAMYVEPALLSISQSDVATLAREILVYEGGIHVDAPDVGTYFPTTRETFLLHDRSGTTWPVTIADTVITCGILAFLDRENQRLIREGKQPSAEQEVLTCLKTSAHSYHVDSLKPVSISNPAQLGLPVLRTLLDHGCINVPAEYVGTYFPMERASFSLRDLHGERWEAHVASKKISYGIKDWVNREETRLLAARGIQIGDTILFTHAGNCTYEIEIKKHP